MVLLPSDVINGWNPDDFRTIIELDEADPNAQEIGPADLLNVPVPEHCPNGAPPAFRTASPTLAPPTPAGHAPTPTPKPDGHSTTPDLQHPPKKESVTATTIRNVQAYQMTKKTSTKTPLTVG